MAFEDWSTKIFPTRIKIGDENTPDHPLHIIGEGDTDSTKSLQIDDSNNNRILQFLNNGSLQVGSGTNHDSSWLISTDGQREGIQIRDENNGNERLHQLRSDNIQFRNSDTNVYFAFSSHGGNGSLWQRRLDNNEFDWRMQSDVGTKILRFEDADEYKIYTFGTQGNFDNDQPDTARPLYIQGDLLESTPIPAEDGDEDANATTQNSPELRLVGRYWDGSQNQNKNSSIRHIMEDTTPSSRIRIAIDDTEIISIKDNQRTGFNTTTPNTTVDIEGSFGAAIRTVTSNYLATDADHTILADASSSDVSIELPIIERAIYNVKRIDNSDNDVIVHESTIDGGEEYVISTQYESATFHCDGSQYWTI